MPEEIRCECWAHCTITRRQERERAVKIVMDETKNGHWSSQHLLRKALAKSIQETDERKA